MDQHDNSLVRYTIIARVEGKDDAEALAFHKAWMEKYGEQLKKNAEASASVEGRMVLIISPGWHYVGLGRKNVTDALKVFGVEVKK